MLICKLNKVCLLINIQKTTGETKKKWPVITGQQLLFVVLVTLKSLCNNKKTEKAITNLLIVELHRENGFTLLLQKLDFGQKLLKMRIILALLEMPKQYFTDYITE